MPDVSIRTHGDDVDQIVDTLLADPGRAEDIKTILRKKLNVQNVVGFSARRSASTMPTDDVEDMWDNVPV